MRPVVFGLIVSLLAGCGYSVRVKRLSDEQLCDRLGIYELKRHKEGVRLTQQEIDSRTIGPEWCARISEISQKRYLGDQQMHEEEYEQAMVEYNVRAAQRHKQQLCERLAVYHYKGAYRHYRATLDKIIQRGFADEECQTMADFYLTRLDRKAERMARVSAALDRWAEQNQKSYDRLYGPGTRYNPIHVEVK